MNYWRALNYGVAFYSFAAGAFYLQYGLYHMFYYLDVIGSYPVSAFMVGVLVLLFDYKDSKTAIPFLFVWQSLANLLPLPMELINGGIGITASSLAKTEGTLMVEGVFLFIGLATLKLLRRLPKIKASRELLLLGVALAFAELGDSYHLWSAVLAYWLLIGLSRPSPESPSRVDSQNRNPSPNEASEQGTRVS
jgi:hypothetical protein